MQGADQSKLKMASISRPRQRSSLREFPVLFVRRQFFRRRRFVPSASRSCRLVDLPSCSFNSRDRRYHIPPILWESRSMACLRPTSILAVALCIAAPSAMALPPIGAAPKGDAKTVASRIIKYNFPTCKRVADARRMPDGSIRAKCDSTNYLVFTMFNAREGKTIELAMNCTAAKSLLNISC